MQNESLHLIASNCRNRLTPPTLMTDLFAFRPNAANFSKWGRDQWVSKENNQNSERWMTNSFIDTIRSDRVAWLQNATASRICRVIQPDIIHEHKKWWLRVESLFASWSLVCYRMLNRILNNVF